MEVWDVLLFLEAQVFDDIVAVLWKIGDSCGFTVDEAGACESWAFKFVFNNPKPIVLQIINERRLSFEFFDGGFCG